jgi:hypothetical protein
MTIYDFPRAQADALASEFRASISGEVRFDDATSTSPFRRRTNFPNLFICKLCNDRH